MASKLKDWNVAEASLSIWTTKQKPLNYAFPTFHLLLFRLLPQLSIHSLQSEGLLETKLVHVFPNQSQHVRKIILAKILSLPLIRHRFSLSLCRQNVRFSYCVLTQDLPSNLHMICSMLFLNIMKNCSWSSRRFLHS